MLVIDLIDPNTMELVWRTYFKQDLSDPVKAYHQLKSQLAKSFSQLPPSKQEREKREGQRRKTEKQIR